MKKLHLMSGLLLAVLSFQGTAEAARAECYFGSKITSETTTADGKKLIGIHVFVAHKNGNNTDKDTSKTFDFDPKKPLELIKEVFKFMKSEEEQSCKDNKCD